MHGKLSGALKNVETFCFKARILFLKSPKRFKKSWRAFSGVPETLEEQESHCLQKSRRRRSQVSAGFLFSSITSSLSPGCSSICPFGMRNSLPRLISMTRVPLGIFMSARRLPPASMSGVRVRSCRRVSISSGSSTPNSLPSFS